MAMRLMTVETVADSNPRSVNDVYTLLDKIEKRLNELDQLEKSYERQFNRSESTTAAPQEFRINRYGDDDQPSLKMQKSKGGKIEQFKIDKVVIPRVDSLKKNYGVIKDIEDTLTMLRVTYNKVQIDFKGIHGSGDAVKRIKSLMMNAQKKYDAALNFLNTIGLKYEPDFLKRLVSEVMIKVAEGITYKDAQSKVYVHLNDENAFQFSHYIIFKDLQDDEGDVYPEFIVVFTCVLRPISKTEVSPLFFVNVMQDFQAPDHARLGRQIGNEREAELAIGMMLAAEHVSSSVGTLPHNLGDKDLKKDSFEAGHSVSSITADAGSITFTLLKGVKATNVEPITYSLLNDLKGKAGKIKWKIKKPEQEEGRWKIRFTVNSPAGESKISTHDLDYFKNALGLDDDKIKKIVRIVNSESASAG